MARKKFAKSADIDSGVNPHRTVDLFALTTDGYIMAEDIACQNEYVAEQRCTECGGAIAVIAQINRSFQGLTEAVCFCQGCGQKYSFIFDISNDTYQGWWADRMGDLYVRTFDGPARVADPDQRYLRT
jgi:hypothetical protein